MHDLAAHPAQAARPAARAECIEPVAPARCPGLPEDLWHEPQREQCVVELVDVADRRRDLLGREHDRRRIECAHIVDARHRGRQATTQLNGAGAALLERSIVEIGIGICVDQLVAERAWLHGVAGDDLDLAALELLDQGAEPDGVHRLDEAVTDRLEHERVIGNLTIARDILDAHLGRRKHHAQRVGRTHLDEVGRNLLAVPAPQDRERPGHVPPPTNLEHRAIEQRLDQHVPALGRGDEREHAVEREAVRLAERDHDPIVGRRSLELEVERPAELLAQREAPRSIDPAAERCVQHELHAPGFVEEALRDQQILAGQGAECGSACGEIGHELLRGAHDHAGLDDHPGRDHVGVLAVRQLAIEVATERADLVGQLARACGRLTHPERNRRGLALGVVDEHAAGLDTADPPRGIAELKDVTGRALDREVFVDRPDLGLLGELDDRITCVVRNRAARGHRGQTRATPAAQHAGDPIAMQIRADAASAIGHAFAQHHQDLLELVVSELSVRRGPANHRAELDLADVLRGARRDDLLGEDIERRIADLDRIEVAAPDPADERGALDQLIPGQREQPTLRRATERVARAADPLQQGRDRTR